MQQEGMTMISLPPELYTAVIDHYEQLKKEKANQLMTKYEVALMYLVSQLKEEQKV